MVVEYCSWQFLIIYRLQRWSRYLLTIFKLVQQLHQGMSQRGRRTLMFHG
jgi:hypothetical protein